MMFDAAIMAGGRSVRMRNRGDKTHKALVQLYGVSLAERSLNALLDRGFSAIAVLASAFEPEVVSFAKNSLRTMAESRGARLECVVEAEPLGTIGGIRAIGKTADALLVVNVDNVSDIDLRALVDHHRQCAAALTIASHIENLTLPFGELDVVDGLVRSYSEKPRHRSRISSGSYVVSREAIAVIGAGERLDVPNFYERLRDSSFRVAAYEHEARWIDINDAEALATAKQRIPRTGRYEEGNSTCYASR